MGGLGQYSTNFVLSLLCDTIPLPLPCAGGRASNRISTDAKEKCHQCKMTNALSA